jgi:hypothetical protein
MVLGAMQLDAAQDELGVHTRSKKKIRPECISVASGPILKNVQDRSQAPYVTSASPSWQPHHSAGGHEGQAEIKIHI